MKYEGTLVLRGKLNDFYLKDFRFIDEKVNDLLDIFTKDIEFETGLNFVDPLKDYEFEFEHKSEGFYDIDYELSTVIRTNADDSEKCYQNISDMVLGYQSLLKELTDNTYSNFLVFDVLESNV